MKNKELLVISGIIIVSIAILIGLFFYQKGQKTTIDKTMTTSEGIKITLHEALFRPSDSNYESMIIKAEVQNTRNTMAYLAKPPTPPIEPRTCYNYDNDYQQYNNNININVNSQTTTPPPVIPEVCLAYYKDKDEYNNKLSRSEELFDQGKFKLYTPTRSIAEIDYAEIGGKRDLSSILNNSYSTLQANEAIEGVLSFKIIGQKEGTYLVTYRGNELTFEVK
ncbi:MAG: hypothetical protein Q7S37_01775 [bacterium]|nr:hypothetical protein [bacterium]